MHLLLRYQSGQGWAKRLVTAVKELLVKYPNPYLQNPLCYLGMKHEALKSRGKNKLARLVALRGVDRKNNLLGLLTILFWLVSIKAPPLEVKRVFKVWLEKKMFLLIREINYIIKWLVKESQSWQFMVWAVHLNWWKDVWNLFLRNMLTIKGFIRFAWHG